MAVDFDSLVVGPCMAIFGGDILYTARAGGAIRITGVFNEAYLDVDPLGRGGLASETASWGYQGAISSEMPVLGVQLSQFLPGEPLQGDELVARGTTYVVREVRPDGQGGALLLLNQYSHSR